jgi:hypothetical protein
MKRRRKNSVAFFLGAMESSGEDDGAVIIAVIAMRMVQAAVAQIIEVIAMRHEFMAAILMSALAGSRNASVRIEVADFDDVFVIVVAMGEMQMAVVEVIHVIAMLQACVSAVFAVRMSVVGVRGAG